MPWRKPRDPRNTNWPNATPPEYVTIEETADYLRVTERTVRQMIRDGRLRAYRNGKLIRLDLREVDQAMQPYSGDGAE